MDRLELFKNGPRALVTNDLDGGPRRTNYTMDRRHITVRIDENGRKIGLDRSSEHWSRLSLRAQRILELQR